MPPFQLRQRRLQRYSTSKSQASSATMWASKRLILATYVVFTTSCECWLAGRTSGPAQRRSSCLWGRGSTPAGQHCVLLTNIQYVFHHKSLFLRVYELILPLIWLLGYSRARAASTPIWAAIIWFILGVGGVGGARARTRANSSSSALRSSSSLWSRAHSFFSTLKSVFEKCNTKAFMIIFCDR